MSNHGIGGRVTKLRFLVAALAALAVLSAFLVFPREAGAQSPSLSVSNITATSAQLQIWHYSSSWWYQNSNAGISCTGGNLNNPKTVTGLQPATSYSFAAFSNDTCTARITPWTAAFTTLSPTLSASSSKWDSATLTISDWNTSWWYKGTQQGAQCTSVTAGTTTATVTDLTDGTSYTYKAYSASTCASSAELDDVTFYTSDLDTSDIKGTSAKLTLSHYAGGAWWYKGVFRIGGSVSAQCTSVASGTTEVSITGLRRGTSYEYTAYSASGCAEANKIDNVHFQTAIPAGKPPKVNGLWATSGPGGSGPEGAEITLSWKRPSSEWNLSHYEIYYKESDKVNYGEPQRPAKDDVTSYTLTGLKPLTTYTMYVVYYVIPDDLSSNTRQSAQSLSITGKSTHLKPEKVIGVEITPGVGRLDVTWKSAKHAAKYSTEVYKDGKHHFMQSSGSGTSITYTDPYLISSGVTYSVRIRGCGTSSLSSCDGPWSDFVSATAKYNPPGAATGVSATAGVNKLSVSWSQASNADGYAVQWKSGNQSYSSSRQNTVSSGSTTTSDITGLTGGTEYTVRVTPTRTHADDGKSGETKGTPKAPKPGKVEGVLVSAPSRGASNLGKLNVSWDEITGATGFHVQWKSDSDDGYSSSRQNTISIPPAPVATSGTITGLVSDTEYTVRVRATRTHAKNGDWSDETNDSKGTTNAGPPARVAKPEVTGGVGTLEVSWDAVSDVMGYNVEYRESSSQGGWSSKEVTGTSTTIILLKPGTEYTVRVTAFNADGDGQASQSKTGIPKYDPPEQVAEVRITEKAEQLEVSWRVVSDVENYVVQWKSDNDEDFSSLRQKTETAKPEPGKNRESSDITGLTAGIKHTVRVKATRRHADEGPWSENVEGTPMVPQPGQVTDVSAESASGISGGSWVVKLRVSWKPPASSASDYVVQWKSGKQNWDPVNRQNTVNGGTTKTHTIETGLAAGTEYTVRVKAKRTNANDGQWSPTAKGTPKAEPPGSVANLTLAAGTEQLVASWDAVSGASGYKVQWKSGAQLYDQDQERQHEITGAGNTTYTYTIRGLQGGVEHTVQVKATKEHADDGPASEAKGRPLSPLVTAPGQQGGDDGGDDGTPGGGGDDVRCPDYAPYETAADVERERDPDTLAEFVKQARVGVGEVLGEETEESEAITRLVECFGAAGAAGDWMSGSVYLFAITDERKYLLAPSGSGLDGTYLNLVDENGCDVAAELIRAARGEELQCKDLGLLPDGDAAGFVQYLWDNPSDPGDDSEPGYEERGEAPGNSPKLSYVERITDEDILPGRIIILVSGYYPGWDPGEEPAPTDGDGEGGCAVASEKNAPGSAALGLFLAVSVLLAVSLRNRPAGKRARLGALRSRCRS